MSTDLPPDEQEQVEDLHEVFSYSRYWIEELVDNEYVISRVSHQKWMEWRIGQEYSFVRIARDMEDVNGVTLRVATVFNSLDESPLNYETLDPNRLPLLYATHVLSSEDDGDTLRTQVVEVVQNSNREAAVESHRQMCLKYLNREPTPAEESEQDNGT